MKDIYLEQLVKRKAETKYTIYKALCILGIVLVVFASFLIHYLLLFVAFFLGLGAYYLFQSFDVEFEYTYVNGQLDFDKILGKARRKHLVTLQMDQLEMLAPKGSHQVDSMRNMKGKYLDLSSHMPDHRVYEMYIRTESEFYKIEFEPGDEMLEAIRLLSPRKVAQY